MASNGSAQGPQFLFVNTFVEVPVLGFPHRCEPRRFLNSDPSFGFIGKSSLDPQDKSNKPCRELLNTTEVKQNPRCGNRKKILLLIEDLHGQLSVLACRMFELTMPSHVAQADENQGHFKTFSGELSPGPPGQVCRNVVI